MNIMKLAIISDIHSNLEALETVLKEIERQKVDKIYCCGDVVGYGANPNECLEILKQRSISSVMGNHDWAVINENTNWFNVNAAQAIFWTIDNLKEDNLEFLQKFPEKSAMKVKDYRILMVHGSPRNPIWEYVYPPDVDDNFVKDLEFDIIIMGHTHIPFIKKIGKKLILNPGSVGQPRDSNPQASFAVVDIDKFSAKIVRMDYDIDKASQKIIKAGLPEFLALRLHSGI